MLRKLKQLLSCMIVAVLLVCVLGKATNIMQRKSSDYKYMHFFEHSEDIDVVFLGTSHVLNSIFPMELWHDYGITSYNFGGHSNQLATTYWVLMNVLDYAKPKVVVIDCLELHSMQKTSNIYSSVHVSLDAFPLSITKIKTASDLLNDSEIDRKIDEGLITEAEKRTEIGLMWDYSIYHSRWDEINEGDFNPSSDKEYGAESRIQIAEAYSTAENPGTMLEEETVGIIYLKRMIETCQSEGIEVVLTYLPKPAAVEQDWIDANTVKGIAEEYGVGYINFLEEDILELSTDCYDSISHLNPSGAWKVTDYLGKYLREQNNVADHRGDEAYSYWDDDFLSYENMKNARLASINDLNTYLMLLEDDNYGFVMNVGDTAIFDDMLTLKLLENKGVNIDELSDETQYIIVCGENTQVINSPLDKDGEYGIFSIFYNHEGEYGVYKDANEQLVLGAEMFKQPEEAVSINVFDMDDRKSIVNSSLFAIPQNKEYVEEAGAIIITSKATRLSE